MLKKKIIPVYLSLILATICLCSQCGKEGPGPYSRISGGHETRPHQYPWMVKFDFIKPNVGKGSCGGSLISERLVLTAKHCVDDVIGKGASWGDAKAGVHDVEHEENFVAIHFGKVLLPVKEPDIESGYREFYPTKENDMAIVVLEEPVDLTNPKIGLVCLPEMNTKDYFGEHVKAMGWGFGFDGQGAVKEPKLKTVDLEVIERKDEFKLFTNITQDMNGVWQDACSGDSGGPLLINENGRWVVIAVVSGGAFSCGNGKVNYEFEEGYGVWTKVTANLNWINDQLRIYTK